jgi:hypothetical protein
MDFPIATIVLLILGLTSLGRGLKSFSWEKLSNRETASRLVLIPLGASLCSFILLGQFGSGDILSGLWIYSCFVTVILALSWIALWAGYRCFPGDEPLNLDARTNRYQAFFVVASSILAFLYGIVDKDLNRGLICTLCALVVSGFLTGLAILLVRAQRLR